eukprot:COSAG06_NODE_610_length_13844_cov_14.456359_8_plen_98_part_00
MQVSSTACPSEGSVRETSFLEPSILSPLKLKTRSIYTKTGSGQTSERTAEGKGKLRFLQIVTSTSASRDATAAIIRTRPLTGPVRRKNVPFCLFDAI